MRWSQALRGVDDAVYSMERHGLLIDAAFCAKAAEQASHDIAGAWARIVSKVGRPLAEAAVGLPPCLLEPGEVRGESQKELVHLLHDVLELPKSPYWGKGAVKLKEGDVKVDAVALGYLARQHQEHHELLVAILALRRGRSCLKYLAKLPTFINPTTGRVHPVFGAVAEGDDRFGALTGRLACKYPELQQIPKNKTKDTYRIRQAFIAAPGNSLIECDYTALEVYILAHITQVLFDDYDLTEALVQDIHGVNAIRHFRDFMGMPGLEDLTPENIKEHRLGAPLRETIKTIWYGMMYGKEGYGFGSTLFDDNGVAIGEERATEMVEGVLRARPSVRQYQQWVMRYIQEHRGIPSIGGRFCDLSDFVPGEKWQVRRAYRRALNFPMQASGADVVGIAMARVNEDAVLAKMGYRLINQVHDALVLEGPTSCVQEAAARVSHLMTDNYPMLRVGLKAPPAWGPTWEACK